MNGFDKKWLKNYNQQMPDSQQEMFPKGSEEARLLRKLNLKCLPQHVAIIMDGNGRWAKQQNLDRNAGHKKGAEAARIITELSAKLGIRVLTLYTFSSENWKRPKREIRFLMNMLYNALLRQKNQLQKQDIRLNILGDISPLPDKLRRQLVDLHKATRHHQQMQFNLALNYGSRSEIVAASQRIIREGIPAAKITPELFAQYLYTAGIPDPDLLIRTSGELRLSNFLLFQSAYTELYFTPTLWPDFQAKEYLLAILDYQKRERRFGNI